MLVSFFFPEPVLNYRLLNSYEHSQESIGPIIKFFTFFANNRCCRRRRGSCRLSNISFLARSFKCAHYNLRQVQGWSGRCKFYCRRVSLNDSFFVWYIQLCKQSVEVEDESRNICYPHGATMCLMTTTIFITKISDDSSVIRKDILVVFVVFDYSFPSGFIQIIAPAFTAW